MLLGFVIFGNLKLDLVLRECKSCEIIYDSEKSLQKSMNLLIVIVIMIANAMHLTNGIYHSIVLYLILCFLTSTPTILQINTKNH